MNETKIKLSAPSAENSWFPGALFLIFMTLKLTGVIDWSWWWVSSPLWIPLALVLTMAFLILSGIGIYKVCTRK